MRDEKEERKKEASKVKQTNKAKQHSTPKAVTFPRKNELPRVGLELTTLYTLDRALYQLSSAGWAQISHLIVTCTYNHFFTLYSQVSFQNIHTQRERERENSVHAIYYDTNLHVPESPHTYSFQVPYLCYGYNYIPDNTDLTVSMVQIKIIFIVSPGFT